MGVWNGVRCTARQCNSRRRLAAPIIIAARPKDGVRQSRESVSIIFSIHHNHPDSHHPVQLPLSLQRACARSWPPLSVGCGFQIEHESSTVDSFLNRRKFNSATNRALRQRRPSSTAKFTGKCTALLISSRAALAAAAKERPCKEMHHAAAGCVSILGGFPAGTASVKSIVRWMRERRRTA